MGVIPNPKMAFIFPISYILALIFPILIKYFPKCVGKGSFPKSQIKSLQYPFCLTVEKSLKYRKCRRDTLHACGINFINSTRLRRN